MLAISLLKFSLDFLSVFIIIVLNSVSGRLLTPFFIFMEVLLFFFPPEHAIFFSFWMPFCVSFYALDVYAMFLSLGRVALCSGWPLGPIVTVSLVT